MKRTISLVLCLALALSLFAACGSSGADETLPAAETTEATRPLIPTVRLISFQPELAEGWEALAADYTAATGVPVAVVTCSRENWEQTLHAHLEEEDAPTLFQMGSPTGTGDWADHCYDLTKTDAAKALTDTDYALTQGGALLALPLGLDAWGIWVNLSLLEKTPFLLEDLTSQQALRDLAQAVTAAEEELGFTAFPAAKLDSWEDFSSLAAAAISLEYQQEKLKSPADFTGTALNGLRSLLELMLQNGAAEGEDPLSDFLAGKALFCLGSASDFQTLSSGFAPEELALIPAFLDETELPSPEDETAPTVETEPTEETQPVEDADPQGLCIGADTFLAVNPQAPEQDLAVTLDFLDWLLATEEGTAALASLGLSLPYADAPAWDDPFLPDAKDKTLLYRRDWAIPSYQWQTALEEALAAYAADPTALNWDAVADVFTGYWAAEYALSAPPQETGNS